MEDLRVRAQIKAQIEQDRLDKARRLQGGIFLEKEQATATTSSAPKTPVSTSDTCRIQVRFPDGLAPMTETFQAKDTLKQLYDKVSRKQFLHHYN